CSSDLSGPGRSGCPAATAATPNEAAIAAGQPLLPGAGSRLEEGRRVAAESRAREEGGRGGRRDRPGRLSDFHRARAVAEALEVDAFLRRERHEEVRERRVLRVDDVPATLVLAV